jgi:hypothetical protein
MNSRNCWQALDRSWRRKLRTKWWTKVGLGTPRGERPFLTYKRSIVTWLYYTPEFISFEGGVLLLFLFFWKTVHTSLWTDEIGRTCGESQGGKVARSCECMIKKWTCACHSRCKCSKNEHALVTVGANDQKMNMRVSRSVQMFKKWTCACHSRCEWSKNEHALVTVGANDQKINMCTECSVRIRCKVCAYRQFMNMQRVVRSHGRTGELTYVQKMNIRVSQSVRMIKKWTFVRGGWWGSGECFVRIVSFWTFGESQGITVEPFCAIHDQQAYHSNKERRFYFFNLALHWPRV